MLTGLFVSPAAAQQTDSTARTDSASVHRLPPVVVTASRTAAPLSNSTGAVSLITRDELHRLPVRTLADAIELAPGLAFLDFDGLGRDPQLATRGFYGGGEADYALVLLNGRPINALAGGRIDWDLLPLAAVERIEIVHGGASALYGDAALGGIVNVITAPDSAASVRWSLQTGSHGFARAAGSVSGEFGGRAAWLAANVDRTDGFRDHADLGSFSALGSLALVHSSASSLTLSVLTHTRRVESPGPITAAALAVSRTQAAPFYRFDHSREWTGRVALDGAATLGRGRRLTGYLVGEYHHTDRVRTLPLAPQFADTKERLIGAPRLLGSMQLALDRIALPWQGRLLVGTDASIGRLSSAYYAYLNGDPDAYDSAAGGRGALDQRGRVSRAMAGAFARMEFQPAERVRLSVGSRVDWLHDTFAPRAPSDGERRTTTHVAVSPKVGLNVRYLRSPMQEGHVYLTVERSFKAATPDQLFDQRTTPVPFPPYAVMVSNPDLEPQYGTSIEAGLYHTAALASGRMSVTASLSVYQMMMRDELDFDLQQFRYVNIGKSRHRGIEAGIQLHTSPWASLFADYTLQAATSRYGENAGKYLKAIPRHVVRVGGNASVRGGLAGSLVVTAVRGIYADDANTVTLPGHARVDARVSYPVGPVRLSLDVFNLLGAEYSSTGYLDPAGSGLLYLYPAAGRVLRFGIGSR